MYSIPISDVRAIKDVPKRIGGITCSLGIGCPASFVLAIPEKVSLGLPIEGGRIFKALVGGRARLLHVKDGDGKGDRDA